MVGPCRRRPKWNKHNTVVIRVSQKIVQVNALLIVPSPATRGIFGLSFCSGPRMKGTDVDDSREMNLPETALLYPDGDSYRLRWFTPTEEEDLCGHATLASAHVLWEEGHLSMEQAARLDA